jgi:hypothetical protein
LNMRCQWSVGQASTRGSTRIHKVQKLCPVVIWIISHSRWSSMNRPDKARAWNDWGRNQELQG